MIGCVAPVGSRILDGWYADLQGFVDSAGHGFCKVCVVGELAIGRRERVRLMGLLLKQLGHE